MKTTNTTEAKNLGATLYFKDDTHNLACDVLARKGFSSSTPSVSGAAKLAAMLNEHAALIAVAEAAIADVSENTGSFDGAVAWLEKYGEAAACTKQGKLVIALANLAAVRAGSEVSK